MEHSERHATRLTAVEAWISFGVVGLMAGGMSMYFGYAAWLLAIAVVAAAFFAAPMLPAVGGSLVGIGLGAALLLWLGSQCPPGTICEPGFAIEPYIGFAVGALVLGLGCSLWAIAQQVRDR